MGTAEDWEGIGEGLLFSAAAAAEEGNSGGGKGSRGVVVVAADLPLHGQTTTLSAPFSSPSAISSSWPAAVAAVRELCAELSTRHVEGGPISVVGYSLGARLAAAAAAAPPTPSSRGAPIGRLALVAGGAPQPSLASSPSSRASRAARDDELARALLRAASEGESGGRGGGGGAGEGTGRRAAAADAFARSWYASAPLWAPLRASRRRVGGSSSSSSLLDSVISVRAEAIEERGADLAAALSGFSPGRTTTTASSSSKDPSSLPTLFVAGGEDARCASEAATAAAEAADNGKLVILEGVGHAVPSEAPVALAGVLADWLLM